MWGRWQRGGGEDGGPPETPAVGGVVGGGMFGRTSRAHSWKQVAKGHALGRYVCICFFEKLKITPTQTFTQYSTLPG